MCILFVYTLLKVVSHYDLNVLSISMMDFKKTLDGWVDGMSSIQFYYACDCAKYICLYVCLHGCYC